MSDREAFEAWVIENTGADKVFSPPAPIGSKFYFRIWQAALAAQQKAEPVAFMFVTRDRKRGQRSEFAAIDWSCPIGEDIEVIDKRPLVYAAPPIDPEGIRLLREAIDTGGLANDLVRDRIDAYLAKSPVDAQRRELAMKLVAVSREHDWTEVEQREAAALLKEAYGC